MKNIDRSIIYWLPRHWAAHIFNDDYTGLSDDEEREIREFLESTGSLPISVDFEQEEFKSFPDAGQKASNCIPFTFGIQIENKWPQQIEDDMMRYVLVEYPEDSSYFEDNDIGYPSYESEDNGARFVPEEDYIKVFGHKPDEAMLYKIVPWPESQELMEEENYEEYSECVYDEKGLNDFICPAYWVPVSKV